jgi:hypothetical protein
MADKGLLAIGRLVAEFTTVVTTNLIRWIIGITRRLIGLIVRSPEILVNPILIRMEVPKGS